MSEATLSSMPDARDAADTRLLEEGNLAALLAKYQPVILGRCIARLQGDEEAEDVAQNVMLRSWPSLSAASATPSRTAWSCTR